MWIIVGIVLLLHDRHEVRNSVAVRCTGLL